MKSLNIALDFDDTFTADPVLWGNFIKSAKLRGHQVFCVTARRESEENIDTINAQFDHWGCQIPIFFCNLASKLDQMEGRGIKIDIWIDDSPFAIVNGM